MPVETVLDQPWTRKHDLPGSPLITAAPKTQYPTLLEDLIDICRTRAPDERLRAAGSHWALSDAAISDHTFIETHDPLNVQKAMGRTLYEVIPGCMKQERLDSMGGADGQESLIHIQAGKRIYQLYAELDTPDDLSSEITLAGYLNQKYGNRSYAGPWAFGTLGAAGGQTVVGALNTGTHGGDFTLPPIADSVVALHLVADGGKHYWIESIADPQLTDDDKLNSLYGSENFEIIRTPDDDVFNAIVVSVGRFGIIYSVVLRVVPQYCMHERRRLHVWQDIKHQIKDRQGPLYTEPAVPAAQCRFLQIAVCLTPHENFQKNLVGITKRWNLAPPLPLTPAGRAERVGDIVEQYNDRIQGPLFQYAGASHSYNSDSGSPGFMDRACMDASFLRGVLQAVIDEIESFVSSHGAVVGAVIGAVAVVGGVGLAALIPALLPILHILKEFLDQFNLHDRLAQQAEQIKNKLLDPHEPDPLKRAAGMFVWQLIAYLIFQSQQGDKDYAAISYAVMDEHDYLDSSCDVNVDSVEVFFDAVDFRLIAFVDALLAYEMMQEFRGLAFLGYASLRFTQSTRATIGMQKYPVTCSVEVACLKGVSGSQELIDYAVQLALNPNIGGVLHWGQRNDSTAADVERLYGDSIKAWRRALSRITDNGRLDGFSSAFTRRTGLEP
jgi:hypothetical protein